MSKEEVEHGYQRRTKNACRRVGSSDEEEAYHSASESTEPASECPGRVTGCPEAEETGRDAGDVAEKEEEEEKGEGVERDLTKLTMEDGNTDDQEVGGAGEEGVEPELSEEQYKV